MAIDPADLADLKTAIVDALKSGTATSRAARTATDLDKQIERLEEQIAKEKVLIDVQDASAKTAEDKAKVDQRRLGLAKKELDLTRAILETAGGIYKMTQDEYDAELKIILAKEEALKVQKKQTAESKKAHDQTIATLKAGLTLGESLGSKLSVVGKHSFFNVRNMASLTKAFNPLRKNASAFILSLSGGIIMSFADAMLNLIFVVDKAESEFRRATGASAEFASRMTDSFMRTRDVTYSIDKNRQAYQALYGTYTEFTMINGEVADSMADTVAVMGQMGVAFEDSAKSFQIFDKMLGQTPETAEKSLMNLEKFAEELGVEPGKLIKQFGAMGPQLSKLGENGEKAFKDLARASKITGLEMGKILKITDKFDTFEGAAKQAGLLNAAIGTNAVNAMDLLMTVDPTERFEMMRDAIAQTGLSFDEMSYFQKKFYADSMGLESVGDLALLMSGNFDAMSDDMNMTEQDYEEMAERAKTMATFQERLNGIMMQLIPILQPLIEHIENFLSQFETNEELMMKYEPLFTGIGAALRFMGYILAEWVIPNFKIFLTLYLLRMVGLLPLVAGFLGKLTAGLFSVGAGGRGGGAGLGFFSAMAQMTARSLLALGIAFVGIGLGIGLASEGVAKLVDSFSALGDGWEQFGMVVVIGLLGAGFFFMAKGLFALAPAATAASWGMVAIGVAALGVGVGFGFAAAGMGELVKAFKGLSVDDLFSLEVGLIGMAVAVAALAGALYVLAAAGTVAMPAAPVLWGLAAAVAALGFAIGYTLQGAAAFMNVFKETPASVEQIEATSSMVSALSKLGEFDYGEVAEDVKQISNAMSGVTVTSANAMAEVLRAMAEASPRVMAVRMQRQNREQGTTGTTTTKTAGTAATPEFTIYLEIDGEQFGTKVKSIVAGPPI
tara:strand:- start:922 stop:3615 length:2694 start_codon:yes stop_codon:yes gene_type:complete